MKFVRDVQGVCIGLDGIGKIRSIYKFEAPKGK